MQALRARGHRGNWFARIGDDDIPCIWREWLAGTHYLDPHGKADEGKWAKYVEALRRDQKAVLTAKQEKDGKWSRAGYIGVFKIANVAITAQGLEFDLIERLPIRLK